MIQPGTNYKPLAYRYNDGGRARAGFETDAVGDCVARSIAIASGLPYKRVYMRLSRGKSQHGSGKRGPDVCEGGIRTTRPWFPKYMDFLGFKWKRLARGLNPKEVYLTDELPMGRLVVMLRGHAVAVIDGVIHDTYNPTRDEKGRLQAVEGYWKLEAK
jgi:hypothetical protein